jgi:hypothetical protein
MHHARLRSRPRPTGRSAGLWPPPPVTVFHPPTVSPPPCVLRQRDSLILCCRPGRRKISFLLVVHSLPLCSHSRSTLHTAVLTIADHASHRCCCCPQVKPLASVTMRPTAPPLRPPRGACSGQLPPALLGSSSHLPELHPGTTLLPDWQADCNGYRTGLPLTFSLAPTTITMGSATLLSHSSLMHLKPVPHP